MTQCLTTLAPPRSTVALAGTLALAACGASNEGGNAASAARAARAARGRPERRRLERPAGCHEEWTRLPGAQPDVTVNYDPVGPAAAASSSSPVAWTSPAPTPPSTTTSSPRPTQRCGDAGVFELPNYIGPIAVVYNLPASTSSNLDARPPWPASSTATSPPGTTRRSPRTTPTPSSPPPTITPVHRSDDSGTTNNFTNYLSKAAGDVWTDEADGVWPLQGRRGRQRHVRRDRAPSRAARAPSATPS